MQQLVLAVYERFLNPRQKYYWNGAAANNNGGGGGGGIGLAAVNLSGGNLNATGNSHGSGNASSNGGGGSGSGGTSLLGGRRFNRRIAAAAAAQQLYRDNVEHQRIAADARDTQSVFASHRRKPNNSFGYRRDYCRHPQHRRYHHSYDDDYAGDDNDNGGDGIDGGGVYRSNPLYDTGDIVSTTVGGEGGIGTQAIRAREAELLLKQIRARKRNRMTAGKQCSF